MHYSRLLCHHLNEVNYSTVPVWVFVSGLFIQSIRASACLANLLTLSAFHFDAGGARVALGESHMFVVPTHSQRRFDKKYSPHIPHYVAFVFSVSTAIDFPSHILVDITVRERAAM